MELRKFLFGTLCLLALGTTFTACSDDDDMNDAGSTVELPGKRAYILYEGGFKPGEPLNDTGIAFYAPNNDYQFTDNIYKMQNNKDLGNLGNSMIEEDDFIYVVASGSKSIVKLNEACVEVARCNFTSEGDPRYITAEDGFLYVSHYGGTVSKIDAKTMSVTSSFKGGQQLEGIAEHNGKLYVANGYTPAFEYLKEVLVIDANSMNQVSSVSVVDNPKALMEEDGKVYVISTGNYNDVKNQFQVIDPRTNTAKTIAQASRMAEGNNDLIYLVETETVYDANWNATTTNKLFSFNTKTQTINKNSFLNNVPEEILTGNIYMLNVDDETGDIYVGTSDYVSAGKIYRFDRNGNLKTSFSAGGVNPNTMLFVD